MRENAVPTDWVHDHYAPTSSFTTSATTPPTTTRVRNAAQRWWKRRHCKSANEAALVARGHALYIPPLRVHFPATTLRAVSTRDRAMRPSLSSRSGPISETTLTRRSPKRFRGFSAGPTPSPGHCQTFRERDRRVLRAELSEKRVKAIKWRGEFLQIPWGVSRLARRAPV